ncbi:MAG: efflux RND transporter periplasmic adaptor subunit [Spirochaetaceae bacterium]|jgi:RND family efflux transporter MFP subunit|nr:efflux RND transporter periplasmic adaptor subunit [Spirochaetaceae bacterium]
MKLSTKNTATGVLLCGVCFVIFLAILFSCRSDRRESGVKAIRELRIAVVTERDMSDGISGFGSLSYVKKVDIASAQDGVLSRLYRREGDMVKEGELLARIVNPQIDLAAGRAENAYSQALAASELARARLAEGELQAEAMILSLEKSADELAQAERNFAEQERKHLDQETLFAAGGVTGETLRSSRFALESAGEELRLMEKELAIRRIGFRDEDLLNAGFAEPSGPEERIRSLITLSTMTLRAELSAAGAALEGAKKEMESIRLAQEELSVISPSGGVLGARYFEEGERIKSEDKLFTLMDSLSLFAVFPVRESEATKLKTGMDALVFVDGTGGSYRGTLDLVAPAADSQTFTFQVRVLISEEEQKRTAGEVSGELKPGMFARVSIDIGPSRKVMVLPETALVYSEDDEGMVFVVRGSQISRRTVTLGLSFGGEREILSGLAPGDAVVERPDSSLEDGEYVQPIY